MDAEWTDEFEVDEDDRRRDVNRSRSDSVDESRRSRRRQVADQATDDALDLPDPLRATLAASGAQLAKIVAALGDRLLERVEDPETTLEEAQELTPTFDLLLRAERQLERFGQIELREREIERKEKQEKAKRSQTWRPLD